MPSIKCSSCGHRILLPTDLTICTNCGAPLPIQFMPSEQAMIPYKQPLVPEERSPRYLSAVEGNSIHQSQTQSLSPYQSSMLSAPPNPFPDVSPPMFRNDIDIALGNTNIATSLLWSRDKLPWWFPARHPDIEGTVIQVNSQMEHPLYLDFVGAIFRQLRDMLWADPQAHDGQHQERDMVFVTAMRIRTPDGTIKDARLEGYSTGAHISLGDTVFLWGWKRRGLLFVRRGYNYTAKGSVSTKTMGAPLLGFFLLCVAIIVLFTYFHQIPTFLHFP